MIIIDLNQVMISNLMAQLGSHTNVEIEEQLLRHMVLNSIRSNIVKFKEFGEVVIACDDKNNWRRQVFPYYKANRRQQRQESELDWTAIFDTLNKIKSELKEYFPYRVIQVDNAEADDVIASLVRKHGWDQPVMPDHIEMIVILSGDKDFVQLQKYSNVIQYNPVQKKYVKHSSPDRYLIEHIIKGDRSDGIPNVASADDCFINGGRQKPIRQTSIDKLIADGLHNLPEEWKQGYFRNRTLVDLSYVPNTISDDVFAQYEQQQGKTRSKMFNYFVSFKLKGLMEHINEF